VKIICSREIIIKLKEKSKVLVLRNILYYKLEPFITKIPLTDDEIVSLSLTEDHIALVGY